MNRIIPTARYYGTLKAMERKFEKRARKEAFSGTEKEEWLLWQQQTRAMLWKLLGLDHMESCPLDVVTEERVELEDGIIREKVIIQTEPDVWMPVYILIPPKAGNEPNEKPDCFIAPPGHQGGGKYSVAGCYEIPAIADMIDHYHYDYGMQLAKLGYVALCPDCRGFGERRDEALQRDEESCFLTSTCFHLAHMAEPLGETVAGMLAWDLMRLIDYVAEREEWNMDTLGCLGFSGGGMQTLWLAALDERIRQVVISGYMYGYRDSLLKLNENCSCNYVPGLWEKLDMGDIGSLIAPRPLVVQSCREDHLNGERGMENVMEQVEVIRRAYGLLGVPERLIHDACEGGHRWHDEHLAAQLKAFSQIC